MAYFEIHKQVVHPEFAPNQPKDWQLCFQYGIYKYDPDENNHVHQDAGYRFIWRRPNGQLQGARGQARLTPEFITILLGKAALQGWYPTPPPL